MENDFYEDLGHGITCIDANYGAPGMACFYLLEHAGSCAIIETGTAHSIENLRRVMADKGLGEEQVQWIIPTHVHLDHAGGAGSMMQLFPGATLVVHPRGARHLIDPSRLIASSISVYGERAYRDLYGEVLPVDASRVLEAADETSLDLAGRTLLFRHTPGHADHHFCVWDDRSRGWFSGDMFGVSYRNMRFPSGDFVMASTTPTQFRPEAFVASVDLLRAADPRSLYLTHYGEIRYTEELADLLCRQVLAYRDFAPQYVGRAEELHQRICDFTLECMAPVMPPGEREACRQSVSLDAQLNVQGLLVWLERMNISAPDH